MLTGYSGVKVFSATRAEDRSTLGDKVTVWLRDSKMQVVDTKILQSSDSAYHCLTIIVFYNNPF